jgi:hypothetical protein
MALTAEQQAIIERRLPLERVAAGAERPVQIAISARELRFLLQAVAHYRDVGCALEGHSQQCDLMYWFETPQGHIERGCESFCDRLVERLIAQIPEER